MIAEREFGPGRFSCVLCVGPGTARLLACEPGATSPQPLSGAERGRSGAAASEWSATRGRATTWRVTGARGVAWGSTGPWTEVHVYIKRSLRDHWSCRVRTLAPEIPF